MGIIITYDIPEKHVAFKKALFALGYKEKIIAKDGEGKDRYVFLPNTTVYHETKKSSEAVTDYLNTCKSVGVKYERCIATQLGPDWRAIFGEPFGS